MPEEELLRFDDDRLLLPGMTLTGMVGESGVLCIFFVRCPVAFAVRDVVRELALAARLAALMTVPDVGVLRRLPPVLMGVLPVRPLPLPDAKRMPVEPVPPGAMRLPLPVLPPLVTCEGVLP